MPLRMSKKCFHDVYMGVINGQMDRTDGPTDGQILFEIFEDILFRLETLNGR